MTTVTAYLREDHERIGGLLALARREPFDARAFAEFRGALLRHIGIEEKIVLPRARTLRGGAPLPQAAQLRIEHAALTSLLVPTPSPALAEELAVLLGAHDLLEEEPGGVYDACEALFGPALSAELAERAKKARVPPLAPHYDGERAHRTRQGALESARENHRRQHEKASDA